MSQLAITPEQNKVLRRLRSPSARTALILFGYAREGRTNPGVTFQFQDGEPPVAAGDGKIVAIVQRYASWAHSPGDLDTLHSFEVTIDHGQGVWTVTAGLLSLGANVKQGLYVSRGDVLGTLISNECFFQVAVVNSLQNPNYVNRHFKPFDGKYVTGQQRRLRNAPDFILRDLSDGIRQVITSGLHYFENIRQRWSLRISVDFNGDGTKTGPAAIGALGDYWNVYAAGAFVRTFIGYYYYYGCTGYVFNPNPQVFLSDSKGVPSVVWLERLTDASSAHGQSSWFDPMLSTYIGGSGEENFFAIRGLPRGTYELYVYSNDGAPTTFYVAVDNGTPQTATNNPTGIPAFIEGSNYVHFQVVVASGSIVSVKVNGYLAGLQLTRT